MEGCERRATLSRILVKMCIKLIGKQNLLCKRGFIENVKGDVYKVGER